MQGMLAESWIQIMNVFLVTAIAGFAVEVPSCYRRYFQHAHFIPIVGVGKRGECYLVHGYLPRQHQFVTTLRSIGPVPADSPQ